MRQFYTLPDVVESLSISMSQMCALIRAGDVDGIQVGDRGQWSIEYANFKEYVDRMYGDQRCARKQTW